MTKSNDDICKFYDSYKETLLEADYISNSDKQTKYVVAKALLSEIRDKDSFWSLIFDIVNTLVYQHFSDFGYNGKLYPWFLKRTEDLGLEDLRNEKGFNIFEADENPNYIERDDIDGKLSRYIKEGKSVLISGPPGVGKTRYVHNELRKTYGYYMFIFERSAMNQDFLKFFSKKFKQLKKERLIWFIDDLHYFNGKEELLREFYQKLIAIFGRIIIVATIRSDRGKHKVSMIQNNMYFLKMEAWSNDDMKKLAIYYGYDTDKLTGAPLYLFKNLDRLKELFERYQEENRDCVWLLRYIKILNCISKKIDYELLKVTYLYLRGRKQEVTNFENAFSTLLQAGFVEINGNYVRTWNQILKAIVEKKDYPEYDQDLKKLLNWLFRIQSMK